jgi:hypothetical protein
VLLPTIVTAQDDKDPVGKLPYQVLAISDERLGTGATIEDVVHELFPGLMSRSTVVPILAPYEGDYAIALAAVRRRLLAQGARILTADPTRNVSQAIRYEYTDPEQGYRVDTVHVRLFHTKMSAVELALEEAELGPVLDYTQVRAEVVTAIEGDAELSAAAKKPILTRARNPSYPVAHLARDYARAKHVQAMYRMADAHGLGLARAAYAACREYARDELGAYRMPEWSDTAAPCLQALEATRSILVGEPVPSTLGVCAGPFFRSVVQGALMLVSGDGPVHERDRKTIFGQCE